MSTDHDEILAQEAEARLGHRVCVRVEAPYNQTKCGRPVKFHAPGSRTAWLECPEHGLVRFEETEAG